MFVSGHPAATVPVPRFRAEPVLWGHAYREGPAPAGLGFIDIAGIFTGIASIFGASSAASLEKKRIAAEEHIASQRLAAETAAMRAQADAIKAAAAAQADATKWAAYQQARAAEKAAEYEYRTAAEAARRDTAAIDKQYGAALDALIQQRLAAVDQQTSDLVSSTAGSIFALGGAGVAEAGATVRSQQKVGAWGLVALAALTYLAINPPKIFGRKEKAA